MTDFLLSKFADKKIITIDEKTCKRDFTKKSEVSDQENGKVISLSKLFLTIGLK